MRHDCFAALMCLLLTAVSAGCGQRSGADSVEESATQVPGDAKPDSAQTFPEEAAPEVSAHPQTAELVLAGGCFWCLESTYEQLRGVDDVVSGYAGGSAETAEYHTVSAGLTKHAEAIKITYDPEVISLETLLRVFFTAAHDPTQVNRQYPDVGRQYRSAVFYADDEQQQTAARLIAELNQSGQFARRIATTLEPLDAFYLAEDYHQDYVKHHPREPYVVAYSIPRAAKVRQAFPKLIRDE